MNDMVGFVVLWVTVSLLLAGIVIAGRASWWRRLLEIAVSVAAAFLLSLAGLVAAWSLATVAAEKDVREMFRTVSPDGPADRFVLETEWDSSIANALPEVEIEFQDMMASGGHEFVVRLSDQRSYYVVIHRMNMWGRWSVYLEPD